MKYLCIIITLNLLWALPGQGAGPVLARVTVYWNSAGSGARACWNGARLRPGHCAVDPRKIPYGSRVVFPDLACVAVDTGPDVVNRKAARVCARTVQEKNAIVVDRFFETKSAAQAWERAHPQFMTLQILESDSKMHANTLATAKSRHLAEPMNSRWQRMTCIFSDEPTS